MRRIITLLGVLAVGLPRALHAAEAVPDIALSIPPSPAVIELILPPGATATLDGKDAGTQRTFEFNQFSAKRTRRVAVAVKFSDGTEANRTVDLEPGQRVRVPVALPPVDHPTTVLTESSDPMLWASFSPDGRRLATASESKSIVLWDLAAGRVVRNFPGHTESVQSVVFSPNGEQLLSASMDTTAALWNVATGRLIRKFKGHASAVNSAVFSPDGKKILTGSTDKTAILWDAETGLQLRTFKGHTDEVVSVAISPDGHIAATASADKNGILWNADTGEKLLTLTTRDTVSGIVFSPDGTIVAASNFSNNVNLWETATGKALGSTVRANLDLNSMAFTPDGRRFFSAGKDATAKLWDTNTREMVREFDAHGADVQSVTPSPDGRLLLSSSRDGTVRLFDVATGMELVSLATTNGGKNWAVVAPDGLFDGSESGRRMVGYRFTSKLPGAVVDQFFGAFYHPGLLAEIFRGDRPMPTSQMARRLPPVLKVISPKARSTDADQIAIAVDAVDQGGGISAPKIFNNGARLAIEPEVKREGDTVHYTFKVSLASGVNMLRVTSAADDGSWESIPAEIELDSSRRVDRKGRLFVVAVDLETPAAASRDARSVAELLQRRSSGLYERVDVVPLLGKDATRARLKETLLDVGALTLPQDTVMLVLSGRGTMRGDHLYLAPSDIKLVGGSSENDFRTQAFDGDELAALLRNARALNRVLIVDAIDHSSARPSEKPDSSGFALRAAVERWSHSEGVYAIAACVPATAGKAGTETSSGLLVDLLLDAAGRNNSPAAAPSVSRDSSGILGVIDWFNLAADRAGPLLESRRLDPQAVQQSSKPKGFPLLVLAK